MAKSKASEELPPLTAEQDEAMILIRASATLAAATRLSGKKHSTLEEAAQSTITLAKDLVEYILDG